METIKEINDLLKNKDLLPENVVKSLIEKKAILENNKIVEK
jgi:hypothetical protein